LPAPRGLAAFVFHSISPTPELAVLLMVPT